MSDKTYHDLAVAYAHAKFVEMQNDKEYDLDSTSEEIRNFLKFYHFAMVHFPEENKNLDISSLC